MHYRHTVHKTKLQMEEWLMEANHYCDLIDKDMHDLRHTSPDAPVMNCFHKNKNGCIHYNKLCIYHDICMAWQNPIPHQDEIPLMFEREFWDPRKPDDEGKQVKTFLSLFDKKAVTITDENRTELLLGGNTNS